MEERQSLLHAGQDTVEAVDGVLEVLEESPTPPATSLNSPQLQVKDARETALSNCDIGSDNSSSPSHCRPVGAPSALPDPQEESSVDAAQGRICQPEVVPEVGSAAVDQAQEESILNLDIEGGSKEGENCQENGESPTRSRSPDRNRASTTMLVRPDIHGDFRDGDGEAPEGEVNVCEETLPETTPPGQCNEVDKAGEDDGNEREGGVKEEQGVEDGEEGEEYDDEEGEEGSINQPLIVPCVTTESGQENKTIRDEDIDSTSNTIDDTLEDAHSEETILLLQEGGEEGVTEGPTPAATTGEGPEGGSLTTTTDHHRAPADPEEVVSKQGDDEAAGDKLHSSEAATNKEPLPDRSQLKPLPIVKDHLTVRMNLGPKLSDASTDELSDVEEEEEMEFTDRPWYKQCRRSRACCINLYFWIVLLFVGSIAAMVAVGVCVVANYRAAERFEETACSPTMTRDVGDRIKCSCGKGCTSDYRCLEITVRFMDEAGAQHHPALQDNEATLGRQVSTGLVVTLSDLMDY